MYTHRTTKAIEIIDQVEKKQIMQALNEISKSLRTLSDNHQVEQKQNMRSLANITKSLLAYAKQLNSIKIGKIM